MSDHIFSSDLIDFTQFEIEINAALEMIEADGLNNIYCPLTGQKFGQIDKEEIRLTLRAESDRMKSIDRVGLVDMWTLRHVIMCSRTSPLFSVHNDKKLYSRILMANIKQDARLFTYLAGKLVYDVIEPENYHMSSQYQQNRLYYRIELLEKLNSLPAWADSMTADDEAIAPATIALQVFADAFLLPAKPEDEAKSAQRCLELLCRIEAMHNLRSALHSPTLRVEITALRELDSSRGYFRQMCATLERVEAFVVTRAQRVTRKTDGNPLMLTAALKLLGQETDRIEKFIANYNLITSPIGSPKFEHVFDALSRIMTNGSLTNDMVREVGQIVSRLDKELRKMINTSSRNDISRNGLDLDHSVGGKTVVRRGAFALRGLQQAAEIANRRLNPAMQSKIDHAFKAKPSKAIKSEKPRTRTLKMSDAEKRLMSGVDLAELFK